MMSTSILADSCSAAEPFRHLVPFRRLVQATTHLTYSVATVVLLTLLTSSPMAAQRINDGLPSELAAKAVVDPLIIPSLEIVPIDGWTLDGSGDTAWADFLAAESDRGAWNAFVDQRSGLLEVAEGAGVPWIPGRGNNLTNNDLAPILQGRAAPSLETLEALARDFIATYSTLLGTNGRRLVLDQNASSQLTDNLWNLEFRVYESDLLIDDARVFFRVNHGNLVQWGARHLPPPGTAVPEINLDALDALEAGSEYVGGWHDGADWLNGKTVLKLFPSRVDSDERGDFEDGNGYTFVAAWEYEFTRAGDSAVWRLRVDATTGRILEMKDLREFSQVRGGYWPISYRVGGVNQPQVTVGWPYANVTPLGVATNGSGVYAWDGNAQAARHVGPYVNVNDNCTGTAGTVGSDGVGDIDFGSAGLGSNDCINQLSVNDNTAASRQQFVHVNKIKEKGRSFYP
ncbi:MAG: hypothetical protein K8J08_10260, partial [Thermoanaerobaculia bacterium]|nr:hypothetical protein [Thermoanaerobaculia bacterium]